MLNLTRVISRAKEKGLSNTFLAKKLGRSSASLFVDWRKGKSKPSENDIEMLADLLDTTVEYLTDQSSKKEKPLTEREEPTDLERLLEQQPGLMFHGTPLNDDDRAKVLKAIKFAMDLENKK